MSDKKNLIVLADGTTLWAEQPQKGTDSVDAWSYHFVRVGWGWKGSRSVGQYVFRIAFSSGKNGRFHPHIDLKFFKRGR